MPRPAERKPHRSRTIFQVGDRVRVLLSGPNYGLAGEIIAAEYRTNKRWPYYIYRVRIENGLERSFEGSYLERE